MYKIGKVVLSRDVKSQKNSLFCTSKKRKIDEKKDLFHWRDSRNWKNRKLF